MTCDGAPAKKQVVVKCHLDKATIAGNASYKNEQEQLNKILRDWSEHLTGVDVVLTVGTDGAVSLFDLEGPERTNAREGDVIEQQRQLLRRVFAPFDISVPKSGAIDPKVEWKHKGAPLQMGLLTLTQTAVGGAASMTHTIDRVEGNDAYIVTDGHSVMGTPENQFHKVDLIVHGQARYNLSAGLIEYSDLDSNGELTAGSIDNQLPVVYRQISWIGRIGPDGTYAALDPKKQAKPEMPAAPLPPEMQAPPTSEIRPTESKPPPPNPPGGTTVP
jgi:hypothetical protein